MDYPRGGRPLDPWIRKFLAPIDGSNTAVTLNASIEFNLYAVSTGYTQAMPWIFGGVGVYLDEGRRRGIDILKALAFGATTLGIGR